MSYRKFWDDEHPPTFAEWKALNLTRPFTDHPIGWTTVDRRSNDAAAAAAFTNPDSFDIGRRSNPTQVDVQGNDRARRRRERIRHQEAEQ